VFSVTGTRQKHEQKVDGGEQVEAEVADVRQTQHPEGKSVTVALVAVDQLKQLLKFSWSIKSIGNVFGA